MCIVKQHPGAGGPECNTVAQRIWACYTLDHGESRVILPWISRWQCYNITRFATSLQSLCTNLQTFDRGDERHSSNTFDAFSCFWMLLILFHRLLAHAGNSCKLRTHSSIYTSFPTVLECVYSVRTVWLTAGSTLSVRSTGAYSGVFAYTQSI